MIEFIFLNRDLFIIGGCLFIILGLVLILTTEKMSQIKIFIIGLIAFWIGIILLGNLIAVSLYSKEYTVMRILKQKPNLKKEYLMKYDLQFLHNVLDELDVKREEKKQKEIQEIINQ